MRSLLVAAIALCLAAGCHGDRKKCDKAARNYASLVYWSNAEKELALLPEGERDLARQKKQIAFENEMEGNIDFIVGQCVSANNDKEIDCMIAAKTASEALKCAAPVKGKP